MLQACKKRLRREHLDRYPGNQVGYSSARLGEGQAASYKAVNKKNIDVIDEAHSPGTRCDWQAQTGRKPGAKQAQTMESTAFAQFSVDNVGSRKLSVW
jgi:hypothetical protein